MGARSSTPVSPSTKSRSQSQSESRSLSQPRTPVVDTETAIVPHLVIGAGIAGLVIARRLQCPVLESRSLPGGRLKTVYNENGTVRYEAGAWRIHSSHARVRKLAGKLGLSTRPAVGGDARRKRFADTVNASFRDTVTRGDGYVAGCRDEFQTGYPGTNDGARHTYTAPRSGSYLVLDQGWTELVRRLVENAPRDVPLDVRCEHRVTNVVRKRDAYHVHVAGYPTIRCAELFVCVPPHACRDWSVVRRHALPVVSTVRTRPLHHIYARGKCPSAHGYGLHPRLGQIIGHDHDARYYQVSYTSGRMAEAWGQAAQHGDLEERVRDALEPGTALSGIQSHYWPRAVHYWVTRPPAADADDAVDADDWLRRCAAPHPTRLPGLWFCGEAFSDKQGWCEGALQTVDIVMDLDTGLRNRPWPSSMPRVTPSDGDVVVDGRVLDGARWSSTHPGGKSAIMDHGWPGCEDAMAVFERIGHSGAATGKILELQYGWV